MRRFETIDRFVRIILLKLTHVRRTKKPYSRAQFGTRSNTICFCFTNNFSKAQNIGRKEKITILNCKMSWTQQDTQQQSKKTNRAIVVKRGVWNTLFRYPFSRLNSFCFQFRVFFGVCWVFVDGNHICKRSHNGFSHFAWHKNISDFFLLKFERKNVLN